MLMMSQKIKRVEEIISSSPKNFTQVIKSKNNIDLYNSIIEYTSFIDVEVKFSLRVFLFINKIEEYPLCPICKDKKLKFSNINKGFQQTCSPQCSSKNNEKLEKMKQTNLEKYGCENVFSSSIIKDKIKETNIKKYGVDNIFKSEDFKKELKSNNLSKFGKEFFSQTDECKNLVKDTLQKRYGVSNPMNITEVKESFSIKLKEHIKSNYNKHPKREHIVNSNDLNKTYIEKEFIDKDGFILIQKMKDYFNFKSNDVVYSYIRKYNIRVNKDRAKGISSKEVEIKHFLKSFIDDSNVNSSNREIIRPFEVDYNIKDKNILIEFNGNYWHSVNMLSKKVITEKYKKKIKELYPNFKLSLLNNYPKNYHLIKTLLAKEKGKQLLHIFEYEWDSKQDIVKSMMKTKLGFTGVVLNGRSCIVKEVENKVAQLFLKENHIQGSDKSKVRLGLYYQENLISIMTFSKSRYDKKANYELLRFCNLLDYRVRGGASKLLSYFIKNYMGQYERLITYADLRYSNGNLYNKLNFSLVGLTPPNYFYYKNNKVYSRIVFQKHKLRDMYNDGLINYYDETKSELEIMKENNYLKIYDCGNLKFDLVKK
jgi:hypothetical protein